MTGEEKDICIKVSDKIYKRHRVRIEPEMISDYFKLYCEYIIYNFNELQQVRLPYMGTFIFRKKRWYRYVFEVMMRRRGVSEDFIQRHLKEKTWPKFINEIEEYDKTFRDEWRGTPNKQARDFTV